MSSPFVYEEPVSADRLIDRRDELAELTDRALDARNSRIEAPRRFGKTSLVRAVLGACQAQGAIAIEVNFLGCVTPADVAERIERAYAAQLDGRLRRWFDGLVRTLQPTVHATPAGVGVTATPRGTAPGLLDRLALPRRVQERSGRQCVIAFDEFQEVLRVDPALPGVFRSELETHGDAAAYLFCGSHPGLMRELFSDRRHAFFAQAGPVRLPPLPPDELGDRIAEIFEQRGRDVGDALGPLLDHAEGHPQRAMLLAHHVFVATKPGTAAGVEQWTGALAAARREARTEIQLAWEGCSSLERRVVKALAHRTVGLTSKEAQQRFGLTKTGSIASAIERMHADGHVVEDETTRSGWRIVDPFYAAWLRDEWPDA